MIIKVVDSGDQLPGKLFKMCAEEDEIPKNVKIAYRIKNKGYYYPVKEKKVNE